MRIAILADSLDNQQAGVYQYTRSLVNALAKKKNRKHEYILIRQKTDPYLPFQQISVRNTDLPVGYASFRLFFLIPRLIKKHNIDAVFEPAHFGPFNLPKEVKRITMIHDLTPILLPKHHVWHSQFLQNTFLPQILKNADLILSNSRSTTNDILKYQIGILSDKIATIPLGRDEFFTPTTSTEKLRALHIEHPYFLFVGTLEPRKNLINLLYAFEKFKETYDTDIQLLLAGGEGWKTEAFHNALKINKFKKDIKLLGYVDKLTLRELYSHAICLLYPSLYEGFGFPILEAMSCGTNVITSNTSSMPEVGGLKATYINPEDPLEMSQAMQKMVSREVVKCQEELINQAAIFSWELYAEEFEYAIQAM